MLAFLHALGILAGGQINSQEAQIYKPYIVFFILGEMRHPLSENEMGTRLIAVQDNAYKSLASTTGKAMTMTEEPQSLTTIASLVLNSFAKWLEIALKDAENDPKLKEEFRKAFESGDEEQLVGLLQRAIGGSK